jgi:uracil-DNA glycosylase
LVLWKKKTEILSIGQAPGIHEEKFGKPFAYTAGKTLFKWFSVIGISEEEYRKKINMSAVCRCFPGKEKAGDRKPDKSEIKNCEIYLEYEIKFHKPKLIIPIGKMAIDQIHETAKYKLNDVIGKKFRTRKFDHEFDYIPLPHPSGLNVWNHTKEGFELIEKAMKLIQNHESFKSLFF